MRKCMHLSYNIFKNLIFNKSKRGFHLKIILLSRSKQPNSSGANSDFNRLLSLVDKVEQAKPNQFSKNEAASIRIVSNGYVNSPKSLLIRLGCGHRFLINCGEGTSRILGEIDELAGIKQLDILLTRSAWVSGLSGVFGLIYSLTSLNNCQSIRFHAPFHTPRFLYDTFHTLKLKSIQFEHHDYSKQRVFDAVRDVQVEHLPISNHDVFGYIITIKYPSMLVKQKKPAIILVIDLPDSKHLETFAATASKLSIRPNFFVHLSPSAILTSSKYKETVDKICQNRQNEIQHLVFNENCPNIVSKEIYVHQTFLNQLDPFIFPLLPIGESKNFRQGVLFGSREENVRTSQVIRLGEQLNNEKISRYEKRWDQFEISQISVEYPKYKKKLSYYQPTSSIKSNMQQSTIIRSYPEVIFLGTSSSFPTSTRNVSGLLVYVSGATSILMDCGEGTLGQLAKFYGHSELTRELVKIKAVLITHFHADHHTGLFEIAMARRNAFQTLDMPYTRLIVCAPENLNRFFNSINHLANTNSNFNEMIELIDSELIVNEKIQTDQTALENIRKKMNNQIASIEAVPVDHVLMSKGFILTSNTINHSQQKRYKIVYSGDCRPSDQLIERGDGCDLLIHEATYEDSRLALATNLAHSTISQAFQIGLRMRAKNLILTHFNSFFSNQSEFLYSSKWTHGSRDVISNLIIAQDFMRINPRAINRLKLLAPGLKLLNSTSLSSSRANI